MQRHEGPSQKSLDFDENLSTNIRYFVAILRFVLIYAVFGRLGAIKCFFGTTTVFLGQELHYYMAYIGIYCIIY